MGDPTVVNRFASSYDFALDDYQLQACEQVAAGRGALVAAPTGAGKTVVGEFACWLALQQGTKCFYTTPIKALSNQKFHDLVERYGAESIGLLTGDNSINADAQIVVMTTEVLRNMIYAGSNSLSGLGFVVMDEVHYLADRFRGAVWEEVILGLASSVQVIALSATVSNVEEFGEWLDEVRDDVAVVLSEKRPVPLYQHVMVGCELYPLFDRTLGVGVQGQGIVNPKLTQLASQESRSVRDDARRPRGKSGRGKRKVSYGSGRYGGATNPRFSDRTESRRLVPSRIAMVKSLAASALLPAIVFIFSRQGCDAAVHQLREAGVRLTNKAEQSELIEIAERQACVLTREDRAALGWGGFLEALSRGFAAHHAGLLPAFKAIIEEGFTRGLIKVVFATETLALGINMPAKTVVLEKLVKYNGETHADITPGEYTQLTGRAGRRGIDVEGHAVVLWQAGMDPRAVAGLASTRTYPLRSSFAPSYNMAVNLVANLGRERARVLLEQSFAQFQTDRRVVGAARQSASVRKKIAELWEAASCDRGDFEEYARLRDRVSTLESESARLRKQDKRAEILSGLFELKPGDIIYVSAGKHQGLAVVTDPGLGRDHEPHPMVLNEKRNLVRLVATDFAEPVHVLARIKIPKKFDPRSGISRKSLATSFFDRLSTLDLTVAQSNLGVRDSEIVAEIADLRRQLGAHRCHSCPDREKHARLAEQALRLEREASDRVKRAALRTNSIAQRFDKVCGVLTQLGYLAEDDQLSEAGAMLQRIYSELDLVVAEAIQQKVFDGLDTPQLAAVLSTLVYESRPRIHRSAPRMPDRGSEAAQSRLRAIWRDVGLLERKYRIERTVGLDIGFAEAAYAWASGETLTAVLRDSELSAGDFVRWVRQVIDLASQLTAVSGSGELKNRFRSVIDAMRRGIVDYRTEEE